MRRKKSDWDDEEVTVHNRKRDKCRLDKHPKSLYLLIDENELDDDEYDELIDYR